MPTLPSLQHLQPLHPAGLWMRELEQGMTASIFSRLERRDVARDRARQIRDRLLLKLEAGPLSPAELARRAGLGVCAVVRCAHAWPSYFATDHEGSSGKPRAVLIDRHHHLKIGAAS